MKTIIYRAKYAQKGKKTVGVQWWVQWFVSTGALKMREWKLQEWKMREHIAWVENAGVENEGATKDGKPSENKTLKC